MKSRLVIQTHDNLGSLHVAAGAVYHNSQAAFQVDALTGGGAINNNYNSTTPVLTVGVSGTQNSATYGVSGHTATFDGTIGYPETYNGVSVNSLSVAKTGSGTQNLAGTVGYIGGSLSSGGTLDFASGVNLPATVDRQGTVAKTFTLAAGTYNLHFTAAQRGSGDDEDFNVLLDGSVVGTYDPSGTTPTDYTLSYSVSAGTHTLSFQGVDTAGGDTRSAAGANAWAVLASVLSLRTFPLPLAAVTNFDLGGIIRVSSRGWPAPCPCAAANRPPPGRRSSWAGAGRRPSFLAWVPECRSSYPPWPIARWSPGRRTRRRPGAP